MFLGLNCRRKTLWSAALAKSKGKRAFGPWSCLRQEADGTYTIRQWKPDGVLRGVSYELIPQALQYLEIPIRGWFQQ